MENTVLLSNNMTHSTFSIGALQLIKKLKNLKEINYISETYEFGMDSTTIGNSIITLSELSKPYIIDFTSESYLTMIASEEVLKKDWNDPSEDDAWKTL